MTLLRRRMSLENRGGSEEPWDIELYKDPATGYIPGGAYSCVQGQTWHVEWSSFTNGFIIDFRQAGVSVSPNYIGNAAAYKGGGSMDYIIPKTANNVKVGQRQWSSSNGCDADWIKIRITQP